MVDTNQPTSVPDRILDVSVSWANLDPDRFAFVPCALCGTASPEARASLVINWCEFYIVQCPNCGLIWRNPMPDPMFLNDLYSDEYFDTRRYPQALVHQVGIPDADEVDQEKRRRITHDGVREWPNWGIHPTADDGTARKLLEIGGGRGYLQRAAAEIGWNTLGLEISPHGIKEAINRDLMVLPIVLDEFCDRYIPYSKFFDLVVFFDFLEHVTEPGRVLRMIRSILKDDGKIILRVPCIGGNEVPRYHLVDHIWHFSKSTVRCMLKKERFSMGREVESGRFPQPDGQVENIIIVAQKGT